MVLDWSSGPSLATNGRPLRSQLSAELYDSRVVWCGSPATRDPSETTDLLREYTDVTASDTVSAEDAWAAVEDRWNTEPGPILRERREDSSEARPELTTEEMSDFGGPSITPRARPPRR
jgi:hypothetical protein